MTTPAWRLSPAVYRRRRLTLLAIVVLVAVVVWVLIAQPWRSGAAEQEPVASPSSTPRVAPTTSAPPSESATAEAAAETPAAETPAADTPAALKACTAGDLTVEAVTDASEYPAGQNPQLSIRLTNRGAADCTMNVGTTGQTFTVQSGDDVWWRSTDCQIESADQIVTLSAGQTVTSVTPVTWDRTRSSVDTCGTERPVAPGGGATYRLSVSIGGVVSANPASFLLY